MDAHETIDLAFRPRTYWSTDADIEYPMRAEAPGFGGGSYLPPLEEGEVEVAGVALASVTGDTISVRAKRVPAGVNFRVVDEYETPFEVDDAVRPGPLSLGELVELMTTVRSGGMVGIVESYLDLNWEAREGRGDPDELREFAMVISPFYAQLARVFEARIAAWVDRTRSGGIGAGHE